jgi:hypothetical protein
VVRLAEGDHVPEHSRMHQSHSAHAQGLMMITIMMMMKKKKGGDWSV